MGGFLSGDPKQMLSPAYAVKKQGLKGISPLAYVMDKKDDKKDRMRVEAQKKDPKSGASLLGSD